MSKRTHLLVPLSIEKGTLKKNLSNFVLLPWEASVLLFPPEG